MMLRILDFRLGLKVKNTKIITQHFDIFQQSSGWLGVEKALVVIDIQA